MNQNPYFSYAESFQKLTETGKQLSFGKIKPEKKTVPERNAPVAMILSPHPDDECIVGALPIRLMREAGFRIVNCAVTLGSKVERREERLAELQSACKWIGYELEEMDAGELKKVTLESRQSQIEHWQYFVEKVRNKFLKWKPKALFFPNSNDWNKTHLGVHMLTLDALKKSKSFFPFLIETEYWGQMPVPNLLVESNAKEVADLMAALSHHRGELERNPFHLRMPSWMQDNVRRGADVIGGQGATAPDFDFATLSRVSRWGDGKILPVWEGGRMLPCSDDSNKALFSQKTEIKTEGN